jgi:hypothetical protein
MANWQDQQWFNKSTHKSQLIPRGSFVTTFKNLEMASRLSSQSVRTALLNLSNMQFLTRAVTGRITQITILKYNDYQEIPTRKVTRGGTNEQQMPNTSSTQLEQIQQREQRKEEEALSFFVDFWQRQTASQRQNGMAAIAMGLKKFQLSFKMQEDIYKQIMGDQTNGAIRSKSIDQQAAERKRAQELESQRGRDAIRSKAEREIFARLRGVPDVQPEN